MKLKALLFLLCIATACGNREDKPIAPRLGYASLKTPHKVYTAGEPILLEFQESGFDVSLRLLLTNSFGNTVIKGTTSENRTLYHVPKSFYRVAGECRWTLLYSGLVMEEGILEIQPKVSPRPGLETYFGPRSLTAGDTDFSMLVTVPTDAYDNPLPDGTLTRVRAQFQDSISEITVPTNDFIAWNNIYSRRRSGRILVGAHCLGSDTKELTTIVQPTLSEDFAIEMRRNHDYADGNQIIHFSTGIIKDQYGNTISDGTLVEFMVTDASGNLLKTMGASVNGVATASMLHPSEPDNWKVTAFITGAAKSNTLDIAFRAAIADFRVRFSADHRSIEVGPLRSFMDQKVPDGMVLQLTVFDLEGKQLERKKTTSKGGMATFDLPKAFLAAGMYHIEVSAAGIEKTFQIQLK